MSTSPVATLHGRDAAIYDLLQRIVAIGRHRRAWKAHDVARVAAAHLPAGDLQQRRLHLAERRATHAEAEAARLRAMLGKPPVVDDGGLPPRRVVELNRSQYEIFAEWSEGRTRHEIAKELELSPGTVSSCISLATTAIGAENAHQAAALVNRGVVAITIKDRRAA